MMGLDAIMTGLRYNSKDDYEAIEKAEIIYDTLYYVVKLKFLKRGIEMNWRL